MHRDVTLVAKKRSNKLTYLKLEERKLKTAKEVVICASPTGTTNWVGASRFNTFSKQSSLFFCLLTKTVLNTIQIIRYKLQDVKEQPAA